MIYAFTGKTGSGKTYRMVQLAYQAWLDGADIYSNTTLNFQPTKFSRFRFWLYGKFSDKPFGYGRINYFEHISEILEVKNGVIMFDEAQVLFNARLWESLPEEFSYKLQQHRKHRLDLYCTTQNMGTIDIMYRRLVQVWWHHERIVGFGDLTWGLFRSKLKDIDFLYNSVDDLQVPDVGTSYFMIGKIFWWRKKLYDTFYDIGFKRFKTIWQSFLDPTSRKFKSTWWIIPKKWKLKDAQKEFLSVKSSFFPIKSARSRAD